MKYVILQDTISEEYWPIVFDERVTHSSVVNTRDNMPCKVHSAGFFERSLTGELYIYGQSHSLNQQPKEGDKEILETIFK